MKSSALILVLSLVACRPGQPCPTCEDVAGDDPVADLNSLTDLPCAGADLETDHLNCGACGNECTLRFSSSKYGVGTCEEGECDPANWAPMEWPEPTPLTCDELCGSYVDLEDEPASCVARGCSGLTALVCSSIMGESCQVFWGELADLEFAGACDEPIPWPDIVNDSSLRVVYCCCEP
jgi:hypothetical protein